MAHKDDVDVSGWPLVAGVMAATSVLMLAWLRKMDLENRERNSQIYRGWRDANPVVNVMLPLDRYIVAKTLTPEILWPLKRAR